MELFKKLLGGAFAVMLLFAAGCEEKNYYQASKKNEEDALNKLRLEIVGMSGQITCDNAADWDFIAMGAKPCGGPTHYIAYSKKIDVDLLKHRVAQYIAKEKAFNVKWNVASDCMFIGPPKAIECVGDKPRLVY